LQTKIEVNYINYIDNFYIKSSLKPGLLKMFPEEYEILEEKKGLDYKNKLYYNKGL